MANRIIAGIDIGSTKIAAVIAMVENNGAPRVIGESSFASSGIRKGEITGIDEAINSIAQALTGAERMAGLTVSSVYVSINGKHIISNNNKGVVAVADDEINIDDVARAMEQAKTVAIPPAREIVHLIQREFIVDTQTGIKSPEGMTGKRLEVDAHIISATTTALHNLRKCIQSIGLKIDGEVFTGWASSQAVLTPTEKELGVLLIDVGGGTSSVTTFEDNAVTYSTSIPFGGINVTRDLAALLRLSIDDAEKVKINIDRLIKNSGRSVENHRMHDTDRAHMRDEDEAVELDEKAEKKAGDILDVSELEIEGVKTISRKMFNDIVKERMQEIFELVRDNIAQSGYEFKLPAGVVITGGSAELPGITAIARDVFGTPARVGYPRGLEGLVDDISSPAFAATQGLILHGLSRSEDIYNISTSSMSSPKLNSAGVVDKITGFFRNLLP